MDENNNQTNSENSSGSSSPRLEIIEERGEGDGRDNRGYDNQGDEEKACDQGLVTQTVEEANSYTGEQNTEIGVDEEDQVEIVITPPAEQTEYVDFEHGKKSSLESSDSTLANGDIQKRISLGDEVFIKDSDSILDVRRLSDARREVTRRELTGSNGRRVSVGSGGRVPNGLTEAYPGPVMDYMRRASLASNEYASRLMQHRGSLQLSNLSVS